MNIEEQTYSISEIRDEITRLPEHFDQESGAVTVTSHGKPVMAILPWKLYETLIKASEYEGLIETIEIMSDDELMAAFHQGVQELAEGKGELWDDAKKDLDL